MPSSRDKESALFGRLFPHKPSKSDYTKLRILRAAVECIGTIGVDKMTFHSVGQRSNMNAGQVKYHFKEKEDLLRKVIEYCIYTAQEIVLEKLKQANGWQEQIEALLLGFFAWIEKHPHQGSVFLSYYYFSSIDEKLRELHTRTIEVGRTRVATILGQARAERDWSDEDIRLLGDSIWAIIDGFALYEITTVRSQTGLFRDRALAAVRKLLKD